ncbi:type II toxin-antitoxin system HigB family toxin [Halomonas sp. SpR8]|uniref:type II toxin-antitoxin system HigB family toxin n=1 Tax=Halomonas sp. SpR8 TaxID=3050463 RepID=UPI0027E40B48|nr:type II toxin-antitoxin system HigB family toxin [Halomonas sp. SpR8]MDQ7729556.1 type II toxin-antitoxin system HigB family toxin [Halomonas sp. SpR8]
MHVVTQKRIWEAKEKWPQSATSLDAWFRIMKGSEPQSFAEMKEIFPATDKVGSHHVFDIGGNKIRLIATVHYRAKRVFIRHILDHPEYDKGKWKE